MSEDTVSKAEYDRMVAERDQLRAERDAWINGHAKDYLSTTSPFEAERKRQEEDARIDAQVRARQDETARLAAQREQAALADARGRLDAYKDETSRRFMNNGGDEAEFRSAWPKLREKWLIEQSAADPFEQRVEEIYERMQAGGTHRF